MEHVPLQGVPKYIPQNIRFESQQITVWLITLAQTVPGLSQNLFPFPNPCQTATGAVYTP